MDFEIAVQQKRQRKKKRLFYLITMATVLIVTIVLTTRLLTPSLKLSTLSTAKASMGSIRNVINCFGEVLPEYEELLTSTVQTKIEQVLVHDGKSVEEGQLLMVLEKEPTQATYQKMKDQLALQQNKIKRLQYEIWKKMYDLRAMDSIKKLDIGNLRNFLTTEKKLFEAGGNTRETVEQAELKLKIAQIEAHKLQNEIRTQEVVLRQELNEAVINTKMQQADISEYESKIQGLDVISPRKGVVSWINKSIGSNVKPGDVVAKVADISSFKIVGKVSESFGASVKPGMGVNVTIQNRSLPGRITSVQTAIQNGLLYFEVTLENVNTQLQFLKPNMKVELSLITSFKNNTLLIPKGVFYKGFKEQDLYVIRNGMAYKRKITFGMTDTESIEVLSGLKPDEEIILTDLSEITTAEKIKVD
ncbi:efflux RND transporter periplasmic adaptor subunit [Xanthocytophaga agilis]|uniref:HlyD family efflux transporter periplasmic adaptor subunit n=1 Tax=Xanthocytophaga agilis TaxID=3048010 RepID=A0AAE3RD73_9BACT|nr:HlyD family efflux transporter periplasmic adaptor subunit [Xanthocytophaga agilis]MDJ1505762.1 HlyD family efflux transporter periplasmic adaptor subunit [Xanthocytophaga agilis]